MGGVRDVGKGKAAPQASQSGNGHSEALSADPQKTHFDMDKEDFF